MYPVPAPERELTPWARWCTRVPYGLVISGGLLTGFLGLGVAMAIRIAVAPDPSRTGVGPRQFLLLMSAIPVTMFGVAAYFQDRQGRRDLEALLRWPEVTARVVETKPTARRGKFGRTWTPEGWVENSFMHLVLEVPGDDGEVHRAEVKGRGPPELEEVGHEVPVLVDPSEPGEVVCLELGERCLRRDDQGRLDIRDATWRVALVTFGGFGLAGIGAVGWALTRALS